MMNKFSTSTINERLAKTIAKTLEGAGLYVSEPTHYTKRCDEWGIASARESEDVKDRANTRLSFWLKNDINGVYGYREGDIFVNVGRDTRAYGLATANYADCIETHEHMNNAKEIQLRFRNVDDMNKSRKSFVDFLNLVALAYHAKNDEVKSVDEVKNADEVKAVM